MKIVFGNLKMNFLYRDFQVYLDDLRMKMQKEEPKVILGLAVPYIYLKEAADKVGSSVKIMAQDLHPVDFGAFTSSISAAQIASIEVPATIVGHSECRAVSQNSLVITNKIKSAIKAGLDVIYCCGKSPLEEVEEELKIFSEEELKKIIVAYEPISAIGSGSAMNADEAERIISDIRNVVAKRWGKRASESMRILYGGSVNLTNYKEYLEKRGIDGVLVGGASLKVDDFWKMAVLE